MDNTYSTLFSSDYDVVSCDDHFRRFDGVIMSFCLKLNSSFIKMVIYWMTMVDVKEKIIIISGIKQKGDVDIIIVCIYYYYIWVSTFKSPTWLFPFATF